MFLLRVRRCSRAGPARRRLPPTPAAPLDPTPVCSWAISAKEQWCDFFPEAINAAGFEYYNTTITPTCKR